MTATIYPLAEMISEATTCIPNFRWKFRCKNPTSIVYCVLCIVQRSTVVYRPTVSKMLWKLSGCLLPVDSLTLEVLPPVSINKEFPPISPFPNSRRTTAPCKSSSGFLLYFCQQVRNCCRSDHNLLLMWCLFYILTLSQAFVLREA